VQALCVGRHQFLSEHLARVFAEMGLDTAASVGLENAAVDARASRPDVIICDYDLLATVSLATWESDELLSRTPVIAVSLTRRTNEAHLRDVNGIAGFMYLPTLTRDVAHRLLHAVRGRAQFNLPSSIDWSRRAAPPSPAGR
jgi:DNA-binding NarL/FixJ family response regulator